MVQANFTVDSKMSPQELKLHALIEHLMIVLSDKEKFIIQNRFALMNKERMTLEQIGKHFGVTRERIRQIEKSALRKLERNAQNTNLRILTEFAKALLEKQGGVVQNKHFKNLLMQILPNITEQEIQDLHLALILDADIHFESNTLKYAPYWRISSFDQKGIKEVASAALKILKNKKQVISIPKLTQKINDSLKSEFSESAVENILRVVKECKFIENGVGLYAWRHIHPRTLRDKIFYVFRREKKPLHFQKISSYIKESNFDSKNVNTQAVHNELIRNQNFILIGRGIYALAEWGFKTGTVADVIEDILSDGTPRSREEITKAVLDKRHVKTITIYLNLKNKSQFVRVGRDKYTLAKFAS